MNIVKFKDIRLGSETPAAQTLYDGIYNEKLKNQYKAVVNWKWIVELDFDKYMEYSEKNIKPDDSIDLEKYIDYVDWNETEKANSVSIFVEKNKFTPDSDITIEELKNFRTWLASIINKIFITEDDERVMLSYYENNMYDDVIRKLALVDSGIKLYNETTSTGCGCCNNSYDIIYAYGYDECDPISVYASNIYNIMVKYFSDLNYWIGKKNICGDIQKYLENIVKMDFTLVRSSRVDSYSDCTCVVDNSQQDAYKTILTRLAKVFGWIYNDEITGHKNEASTVLSTWAKELYENMQW